jgi:hypothetical protein
LKLKFIGNPHVVDNRSGVTAYGIYFPANVAVEVSDARAASKLALNSHFVVVPDDEQALAPSAAAEMEVHELPIVQPKGRAGRLRKREL